MQAQTSNDCNSSCSNACTVCTCLSMNCIMHFSPQLPAVSVMQASGYNVQVKQSLALQIMLSLRTCEYSLVVAWTVTSPMCTVKAPGASKDHGKLIRRQAMEAAGHKPHAIYYALTDQRHSGTTSKALSVPTHLGVIPDLQRNGKSSELTKLVCRVKLVSLKVPAPQHLLSVAWQQAKTPSQAWQQSRWKGSIFRKLE